MLVNSDNVIKLRNTSWPSEVREIGENPIYKEIWSMAQQCKQHRSPLHHLAQLFPIHSKNIEEIRVPCYPPEWTPITDIQIDGRKEDVVKCAEKPNKEVQIFTNGSGHSSRIGAATILR